ncbi:hypothetical protein [Sphingomonas soli]|uniref:hypothetical protein n=1 Tax=Sphingomonas soli TaxID=266127 RepID=UPI000831B62C|nr:hypothetical protein [Sphingomonas soli]
MQVVVPWPPSLLSGHANGNRRWAKIGATKKHREWARLATLAAGDIDIPITGDIRLHIRFEPPNRRGDRTNYPNRMKPALDGIATALGVNDSRFLPSYEFGDVCAGGRVVVTIGCGE